MKISAMHSGLLILKIIIEYCRIIKTVNNFIYSPRSVICQYFPISFLYFTVRVSNPV